MQQMHDACMALFCPRNHRRSWLAQTAKQPDQRQTPDRNPQRPKQQVTSHLGPRLWKRGTRLAPAGSEYICETIASGGNSFGPFPNVSKEPRSGLALEASCDQPRGEEINVEETGFGDGRRRAADIYGERRLLHRPRESDEAMQSRRNEAD